MELSESTLRPADLAVFTVAGGALVYLGLRKHAAWRFLFTTLGAALLGRGLTGIRKYREWREIDRKVDEMSMQSFPASDPPAY